ncbi:MAG: sigma-70 family RNA polymerase sigma factor [Sedimentisphaerales bacterium]|nr:sigma-70 family RNA polymerase sigma factor [Sedimentisphaerales bacterium]
MKAYTGAVFAICLGMLKDRHDAEDVTQQKMLKGFMRIREVRQSERFGVWIGQIARHACIDAIRRRKRDPAVAAGDRPGDAGPRDHRRLEAALAGLEADYRVPLLLYYFNGRSTKSIAATLGLTQGTVQTRLSRARRRLRALLEAQGDTTDE